MCSISPGRLDHLSGNWPAGHWASRVSNGLVGVNGYAGAGSAVSTYDSLICHATFLYPNLGLARPDEHDPRFHGLTALGRLFVTITS